MTQRFALDQWHRVIRKAVHFADRQNRNDVGLLQRRGGPDLALEPLGADARREFRRQDLDHDFALESRFFRRKNARHPAAAKLALERVRAAEGRLELRTEVHIATE